MPDAVDLARWSGGSSSGAASAVAAGLVAFAIGSETWGSITCPAAFCGVTGLRPTYGVVPRHGAMALSVHDGQARPDRAERPRLRAHPRRDRRSRRPRSERDLAARGARARPPGDARGLRVAVLGLPTAEPSCPARARRSPPRRTSSARRARSSSLPRLPELPYEPLANLLIEAEAATAFEELIRSGRTRELADASHRTRSPEDYLPKANAADYVRAMRVRGEVQRALAGFFARFDLVLAPNLPFAPPRWRRTSTRCSRPRTRSARLATSPASPPWALPMGFSGKLPLSMQLVGPPLEEGRLPLGRWRCSRRGRRTISPVPISPTPRFRSPP